MVGGGGGGGAEVPGRNFSDRMSIKITKKQTTTIQITTSDAE